MDIRKELITFTERALLLRELLDSDDILPMTLEEVGLLEGMQKGLEAYCAILKRKLDNEASIIKLKDKREQDDNKT